LSVVTTFLAHQQAKHQLVSNGNVCAYMISL
jgi:hypothetical protein